MLDRCLQLLFGDDLTLEGIKVAVSRKIAACDVEQSSKQREAAERAAAEGSRALSSMRKLGATTDEIGAMIEQPALLPQPAVAATIERVQGILRRQPYKAEVVRRRLRSTATDSR